MTTPTTLTLFCLVDGEATSNAFSVKAPSSGTVDDLKKLIKAEKAISFSDIDADELTLWRVSIPASEDDDETSILIDNIISDHKKKLNPLTRLTKVFPEELPEETIHIIVQRPPLGDPHTDIKMITDEFFAPGSDVTMFLDRFVRGQRLWVTEGLVSEQ
ncbi:hypothetical protein DFQ26_003933 [Actinomortierella ambigua]|nr:hypothetical protein DFQ26_003933 [Actinomortierella ambigua]